MKFKQVSFAEYKDILYPLFERHWAEIVTDDKAIPIILDLEVYNTLEKDGKFITIVAEVDDKPVGYVCYVLSKLRHFAPGIVAQTDAIFLSPEYRGGRNALNMLLFAEKVLIDLSVDLVATNVTTKKDFSSLLQFLGYDKQEVVYTKGLK